MIGATLGSYTVERELGRGGMGAVYAAVHVLLGRRAAVKVLLGALSRDEAAVQRFFNEARAASAIKHPSIVEIYDFGWAEDEGGEHRSAYIVMELMDGESLASRLARVGKLPVPSALLVARQIATALGAAHRAGIVHRDLKPDNVFLVPDPEVTSGERVKLLDFGIAKLASQTGGVAKTTTGAIMGTPHYMSPEQCEGSRAVDAKSDLYALGCMLFQMISGRLPFEGEGIGGIIGMHLYVEPPLLRSRVPDAPEGVEALVTRLLAKAPDDRPASAEEVAAELGRLGSPTGALPPVIASSARAEVGVLATLPNTPAGAITPSALARDATMATDPTLAPGAAVPPSPAAPRRGRTGLVIAAALVIGAGAATALVLGRGQGTQPRAVDAAVAVIDAPPPIDAGVDATADALYAQATQALQDRRWDTAIALGNDLEAAKHPMAAAVLMEGRRGKRVADALAAMEAGLASGDYRAVRTNLDVVYYSTVDGEPARAEADEIIARTRPKALAAATEAVTRHVAAGRCLEARTVVADTAADWGVDATRAMSAAVKKCKQRVFTTPTPEPTPPAPVPDPTPPAPTPEPPNPRQLLVELQGLVRGADWTAAGAACGQLAGKKLGRDVRTQVDVACATAACQLGDSAGAETHLRRLPRNRRSAIIDVCVARGVLLPLDLIMPPEAPVDAGVVEPPPEPAPPGPGPDPSSEPKQ